MTVREKLSYIRGLMEGMKFDVTTDTGKLFAALLDAVTELADDVDDLGEEVDVLEEYVEEIDEDLGDVEEVLFMTDEDDEEDDDDFDYNDDLDGDDDDLDFDDEDDEDDEESFVEAVCPHCGDTIYYDVSLEGRDILCPNCNQVINKEE